MPERYKDWKYAARKKYENESLNEHTIQFWRDQPGGFYDEIRLDSHEIRRGNKELSPHFHMKFTTSFKSDSEAAVEQIKSLIDNYLNTIAGEVG